MPCPEGHSLKYCTTNSSSHCSCASSGSSGPPLLLLLPLVALPSSGRGKCAWGMSGSGVRTGHSWLQGGKKARRHARAAAVCRSSLAGWRALARCLPAAAHACWQLLAGREDTPLVPRLLAYQQGQPSPAQPATATATSCSNQPSPNSHHRHVTVAPALDVQPPAGVGGVVELPPCPQASGPNCIHAVQRSPEIL